MYVLTVGGQAGFDQRSTVSWPCVWPSRYDTASHLQRTHEVLLVPVPARRARVT